MARMRDTRGAYKARVGKLEEKRPPEKSRLTWEDNIKMDQKVKWGRGNMDWINVAQDTDRWWAPVNVVKASEFHKMWVIS